MIVRLRSAVGAVVLAVLALVVVVALPGPWSVAERAQVVGIAAAFAVCLQLFIDVADGSRASIGNTVAIAMATQLHVGQAVAVMATAMALTLAPSVWRSGRAQGVRAVAWVAAASSAAIVAHTAARPLIERAGMHGDVAILARVVAAGTGFLTVELGVRWLATGRRLGPRPAAGVRPFASILGPHVAILCAAALLVLGRGEVGAWAVLVAAAPLLIIHFSFARYARARQTYDQAVRALSIVPEVAGHASLGHGERTAFYASALSRSLRLAPATAEAVVTAARIHHLGGVLDERGAGVDHCPSPGASAAGLLSEISFLAGVAGLVADVDRAEPGRVDLRCAIVRVASTFDELTSSEVAGAGAVAAPLLAQHPDPVERAVAIDLVHLCERQPGLVLDAQRAGRYPPPAGLSDSSEMSNVDHGAQSNAHDAPS